MIKLPTFSDFDLRLLWESFNVGYNKKQLMQLMEYDEKTFNEAYHQARMKFTAPIKAPRNKPKPAIKKVKVKYDTEMKPVFKRPKAEYSNHSPYRIASPGIIRQ